MRLLAYGGTRYEERQRIGEWPSDLDGVLQDKYGLAGEFLSFGVGRRGRRPHLIVRQRQNLWNRGGYPYTLLLDPGDETWTSFGWNAALLLKALFEGPSAPGDPLLKEPERLGQKRIEELLQNLAAPPTQVTADSAPILRMRELLVAGVALSGPVAVSLAWLGLSERPSLDWMAGVIAELPPAFRCSAGWVVGSGAAHGRAFGTKIIIDDQAEEPVPQCDVPASTLLYWRDWQTISSHPRLGGAISKWSGQPVWDWTEQPEIVLDRASALAGYLTTGTVADDKYDSLREPGANQGPLAAEIHEVVICATTDGEEPFTEASTRYLMARSLDQNLEITESLAARMDCVSVEEELENRHLTPWGVPANFRMPSNFLIDVLGVALGRAEIGDVPDLFRRILDSCGRIGDIGFHQLAERAVKRLPEISGRLTAWMPLKQDKRVGALFERGLAAKARQILPRANVDWAFNYIYFANDPGGSALPAIDGRLILEALKESLSNPAASFALGVAKTWFTALAVSPFRMRMALEWKSELARISTVTVDAWMPFLALLHLFEGKTLSGRVEAVSQTERHYLIGEFDQLTKKRKGPGVPPRLNEILDLIGNPGREVVERMERFETTLENPAAFESWVRGLVRVNARNLIAEQVRMAPLAPASQTSRPAANKTEAPPPDNLEQQIAYILFDVDPNAKDDDPAPATDPPAPEAIPAPANGKPLSFIHKLGFGSQTRGRTVSSVVEPAIRITDPAEEKKLIRQFMGLSEKYGSYPATHDMIRRVISINIQPRGHVFAERVRISRDDEVLEAILPLLNQETQRSVIACLAEMDDDFVATVQEKLRSLKSDLDDRCKLVPMVPMGGAGNRRNTDEETTEIPFCLMAALARFLSSPPDKSAKVKARKIQTNLDLKEFEFHGFLKKLQDKLASAANPETSRESTRSASANQQA